MSGDPITFPTGKVDDGDAPPMLLVHGNADPDRALRLERRRLQRRPGAQGPAHDRGRRPRLPRQSRRLGPSASVVRTTIDFLDHYLLGETSALARLRPRRAQRGDDSHVRGPAWTAGPPPGAAHHPRRHPARHGHPVTGFAQRRGRDRDVERVRPRSVGQRPRVLDQPADAAVGLRPDRRGSRHPAPGPRRDGPRDVQGDHRGRRLAAGATPPTRGV